jgi:hypothetical protein
MLFKTDLDPFQRYLYIWRLMSNQDSNSFEAATSNKNSSQYLEQLRSCYMAQCLAQCQELPLLG